MKNTTVCFKIESSLAQQMREDAIRLEKESLSSYIRFLHINFGHSLANNHKEKTLKEKLIEAGVLEKGV